MKEIKYRVWQNDKEVKRMLYPKDLFDYATLAFDGREDNTMRVSFFCGYSSYVPPENFILMQYTGLKDKNGLQEIYEGDILGINGLVRGNMYESPQIYQERTDLIIPSITSKDWCEAHQTAVARGCKDSQ